jgi:hypothetical protein
MKIIFIIIVVLHGLIHVLGFVKAFELAAIRELTSHISRPFGIVWLICAVLFIFFAITYASGYTYGWIIGLIAVILSQIVIVYFWKDGKFGTIPNMIILLVVIMSYGSYTFNKMVDSEIEEVLSFAKTTQPGIVTEEDILHLPAPVQRWITSTGIIGKPEVLWGYVKQTASMKMKPEQEEWYTAGAIQYSVIEPPAFIWKVELDMMPVIKIKGRDKFIDGKGEMLIKMNSLINIVHEKGEKLDEGTMQRFLGELVWFPSLALSPHITWEPIDEFSAKAAMQHKGTNGDGIFYFDEEGNFTKFIAMRFLTNEPDAIKYPWILTVDDYAVFEGIKVPSEVKATWELEHTDWTWLDLKIEDIQYNRSLK